jgi:hypothetical protein
VEPAESEVMPTPASAHFALGVVGATLTFLAHFVAHPWAVSAGAVVVAVAVLRARSVRGLGFGILCGVALFWTAFAAFLWLWEPGID